MNQRNNRQKPNDAMLYGKMPPQAPDLEGVVLGAVMLEQSALDIVESIIYNPECFYTDANQRIWAAIRRMSQRGAKIDFMTVTEELRASGEIEMVGGSYYVTKVTRDVVRSANIEEHARIIVQKALARDLAKVCMETYSMCNDDYADIFDTIDSINNAITEIQGQITRTKVETLAQGLDEAIAECLENREKEGHLIGTSTGIQCIDDRIGGLMAPDLGIIAGETGGGKTALALNIAFEVAETEYITYVSLEMTKKQLAYRKCSHDTGFAYQDIARGKYKDDVTGEYKKLPDYVIEQLLKIKEKMANNRFLVYDKGGLSVATFRNIVAYNKKKFGCTKFIVDYLQLMNGNGSGMKFSNDTEKISYISNQMKSICNEYEVQVTALSQFSRKKDGEKRLHRLSDLKGASSLEQDADWVILLFEPLKNGFTEVEYNGDIYHFNDKNELFLQFEKCRAGGIGGGKVTFAKKSGRITDPNQHKPDSFKINSNIGEAPQIAPPF